MTPIMGYQQKYGDSLPFLDPQTGAAVKPSDWHSANTSRWKTADETNTKDYNEKVVPAHNQNTGVTPPRPSFQQFALPPTTP